MSYDPLHAECTGVMPMRCRHGAGLPFGSRDVPSQTEAGQRFTAVGGVRRCLGGARCGSVLDQIRRAETTILLAGCYPGSPSGLCRKLVRFVQKTAPNQRKARLVGTQLHSALQDNRWHAQLTL